MPADITTILNAMKSALESAYPTVPVLVKARDAAGSGKVPAPGWMPGDPVPAHVLSELEAETIDSSGTFELVTVTYPVVVEAVFTGAPQPWNDDPDVRQRRIELMNLFYRNDVAGFPSNCFDSRYQPLPVYAGNDKGTVMISGQKFDFTIDLARPGADV